MAPSLSRSRPDAPPGMPAEPGCLMGRWLFLKLLGLTCLGAFLSAWVQIQGLVGSRGILPVASYLAEMQQALGDEAYWRLPTLCWLDTSDEFLSGLCIAGMVLSGLLVLGVAPPLVLCLVWAGYLSLTVAGQTFFNYQWDALLLETAFLA